MSALETLFQNLVNNWICKFLTDIITFFTAGYASSMSEVGSVFHDPNVQQIMFGVQAFALVVLGVRVGYEILHNYIFYLAGDGTADPKGVLFRTAKAAAFIMGAPWAVGWLLQFSISLANDMSAVGNVSVSGDPFTNFINSISATAGFGLLLMIIVALVIWLLINFQMACRAVEIGVLAMAGPLMAVGFVSPAEGLGAVWWKELVVQMMAQPLQILMLRLSLLYMGSGVVLNGANIFLIIGWFWVTYKSPKLVQQFAMQTGIGGATAGVAQQVGKMAMYKLL
jgi:hypothetical protein